jgi:hypothetical protein
VEIDSAFAKEETRIALIAIDEYDHRDNTVSLIAEPLYNLRPAVPRPKRHRRPQEQAIPDR